MPGFKNYLSLVKFSHTIFAMPFAIIGYFLGIKQVYKNVNFTHIFNIKLLLVLVCMVTARSAAMAFNRYLDREFDAKNPRTAIREIPQGIITANQALIFVIFNAVLFIITTYFINSLCFYLSPVALFVILFYSYTKRFTALCHVVLGLGLSLAPMGAYLAITGSFHVVPILFSLAVIFWVSGFDIIFALQDVAFDKSQQLYSIPSLLGIKKGLIVSTLLHIICGAIIILAGIVSNGNMFYWIGVAVFIGLLIYQHLIVKPNDLSKVNLAFMTTNGIASIFFAFFVITDLLFSLN